MTIGFILVAFLHHFTAISGLLLRVSHTTDLHHSNSGTGNYVDMQLTFEYGASFDIPIVRDRVYKGSKRVINYRLPEHLGRMTLLNITIQGGDGWKLSQLKIEFIRGCAGDQPSWEITCSGMDCSIDLPQTPPSDYQYQFIRAMSVDTMCDPDIGPQESEMLRTMSVRRYADDMIIPGPVVASCREGLLAMCLNACLMLGCDALNLFPNGTVQSVLNEVGVMSDMFTGENGASVYLPL